MNLGQKRVLLIGTLAIASIAAGVLFSQKNRFFGEVKVDLSEDARLSASFDAPRERIDGSASSINALKGPGITVVNLWATWCTPCREEMPEFIALKKETNIQFVGLAIDRAEPVRRFMREIGVNYPVLIGDIGLIELTKAYGNEKQALPFSYVLDKTGRIVHTKLGKLTRDEILAISAKMH
jgi:thiol-disulfide isomerase/thioredoxin